MTDVVLFDERGRRAKKFSISPSGTIFEGWPRNYPAGQYGFAFGSGVWWAPSYYATRSAKGWRVSPMSDNYTYEFVSLQRARDYREAPSPDQRCFPNIASVEVYLRAIHARE